MIPGITLLTSHELQSLLNNELTDADMHDLRQARDRVQARVQDNLPALERMEALYGAEWSTLDVHMWVFDAHHSDVTSPFLLQLRDEDDLFFAALQMLALQLIRDNPPETELVEPGYDKEQAVAALLVEEALRQTMAHDAFTELRAEVRSDGEHVKQWRAVDDYAERWDADEETLYEWLEG